MEIKFCTKCLDLIRENNILTMYDLHKRINLCVECEYSFSKALDQLSFRFIQPERSKREDSQ